MLYSDLFIELKTAFNKPEQIIESDNLGLTIKKLDFYSDWNSNSLQQPIIADSEIKSNSSFQYYLFENNNAQSKGLIFLFHGLNEKRWDKYLPWAYRLTKQTGKSVILFPLAFHMNRAPEIWSDSRLMRIISKQRTLKSSNTDSSFANAALSDRLESIPYRFYSSGMQTYTDVCSLIKSIRSGELKDFNSETSIDLFGYSIGAFLSLLLLMDNPSGFFSNSRLFMFCGGAAIDRTFPVSKYILDKLAFDSVSNYFKELLSNNKSFLKNMADTFGNILNSESYFQSLLSCSQSKSHRESRLSQLEERINTVVLNKDEVIRPSEVISTLKSKTENRLQIRDFDYPYNHVIPFPLLEKYKLKVDSSFKSIFDHASLCLS